MSDADTKNEQAREYLRKAYGTTWALTIEDEMRNMDRARAFIDLIDARIAAAADILPAMVLSIVDQRMEEHADPERDQLTERALAKGFSERMDLAAAEGWRAYAWRLEEKIRCLWAAHWKVQESSNIAEKKRQAEQERDHWINECHSALAKPHGPGSEWAKSGCQCGSCRPDAALTPEEAGA